MKTEFLSTVLASALPCRLERTAVEKPWGRTDLPAAFEGGRGDRIGEVWFTASDQADLPLLVKHLFTSEALSVQVHPDDVQARALGLPRGKSECWYVLDCAPGAVIGLGLIRTLDADALRAAALDGSIEQLMHWHPVKPGDFFYIPGGTIHAIGAGISLVEIQQSADITYRLYDYGRPRMLHLDEAVTTARAEPCAIPPVNAPLGTCAQLLAKGLAPFTVSLAHWRPGPAPSMVAEGIAWFIPLSGRGRLDGQDWQSGECWLISPEARLVAEEPANALIAWC